jgi:hypothetical protein
MNEMNAYMFLVGAIVVIAIAAILLCGCDKHPTEPMPAIKGDPNMDGIPFEVSDAILVGRRIEYGYSVWGENGTSDDRWQEWAADLNCDNKINMEDLNLFLEKLEGR